MTTKSNFFYKNVSISDIVQTKGVSTSRMDGYIGMPIPDIPDGYETTVKSGNTSTKFIQYNGMQPLTFGYFIGGSDLLYKYTAATTGVLANSQDVTIPTGAKSCRVISVGGGGGKGGDSGYAAAQSFNSKNTSKGETNGGGAGAFASYNYTKVDKLVDYKTIKVTVGAAGGKGGTGSSEKVNSNYNNKTLDYNKNKTTNVGAGGRGDTGGPSYIELANTDSKVKLQTANANGGEGGYGGNAGYANASYDKQDANGGSVGKTGSPYEKQAKDTNFPSLSTYGDSGVGGAVQIIWLYD